MMLEAGKRDEGGSPASTEPTIDLPDEAFVRLVTRTGQLRAP